MARPVALPSSSLRARSVPKGVEISAPLLSVALSPLSSRLRLLSLTTHPVLKAVRRKRASGVVKRKLREFIEKSSSSPMRCDDRAIEPGAAVGDPGNGYRAMAVNTDLTEERFGGRNLGNAGDRIRTQIILHVGKSGSQIGTSHGYDCSPITGASEYPVHQTQPCLRQCNGAMSFSVGHYDLSLTGGVHIDGDHHRLRPIHGREDRVGHPGGDMRIDVD